MASVTVGTCGYARYAPPGDWSLEYDSKLAAYADAFDCVELNRTFYSLPEVATAERWRREARRVNPDFSFAVKAWQAITHPISSPTWRGKDGDLSEVEREEVGVLQPNRTVLDAWERTRGVAAAVDADVVLLQTPPSFDCSDGHAENLRRFCAAIDRGGLELAWEPRGDWGEHPERVGKLCEELGLVHATDPLRAEPLATTDVAYARLHGLNDDPYEYDYSYGEGELSELTERLAGLAADHEQVFCLLNNSEKFEDAASLAKTSA